MIAGHFGLAAILKSRAPEVPLWSLMLGTVWLDVVFIPLYAAGIETIEPVPGTAGGYAHGIIHADYTHSLLGALVLSGIYGLFFVGSWGRRAALILAAMAFSHWLLDLIVHRADMPILPGNIGDLPLLGLGLWRWEAASIVAELALLIAGAWLYWLAARRVVTASGDQRLGLADLSAALILGAGLITLFLDVTGLLG